MPDSYALIGALSVETAATYLATSKSMIYKLVKDGTLPYVKVGNALRFRVAALDEYLQAHERRNGGEPNRYGMREIA